MSFPPTKEELAIKALLKATVKALKIAYQSPKTRYIYKEFVHDLAFEPKEHCELSAGTEELAAAHMKVLLADMGEWEYITSDNDRNPNF